MRYTEAAVRISRSRCRPYRSKGPGGRSVRRVGGGITQGSSGGTGRGSNPRRGSLKFVSGAKEDLLAQVLEVLARLEADRAPGRDADLLSRPRVAADAPLAGFDLEHAKTAQLDALAPHHGRLHG